MTSRQRWAVPNDLQYAIQILSDADVYTLMVMLLTSNLQSHWYHCWGEIVAWWNHMISLVQAMVCYQAVVWTIVEFAYMWCITRSVYTIRHWDELANYLFKVTSSSSTGQGINSLRLRDAYMRKKINHLAGAKPLSEPKLEYIVNSNLRNKFQWNLKRNLRIFIQENSFENVVRELAAILSRPQCVKHVTVGVKWKCYPLYCFRGLFEASTSPHHRSEVLCVNFDSLSFLGVLLVPKQSSQLFVSLGYLSTTSVCSHTLTHEVLVPYIRTTWTKPEMHPAPTVLHHRAADTALTTWMGRVFLKHSCVIKNFATLFDQTTYFTMFDEVWDISAPQGPLPVAMLAVRAFAVPWYRPARPEQHAYLYEMDGHHHGMCRWLNMLFSYSWMPAVSCAISCSSSCSQTKLGSYLSSSLAILSLLIKLPAEIYCSISGESKALLKVLAPRWRNCHYIDTIWVVKHLRPVSI